MPYLQSRVPASLPVGLPFPACRGMRLLRRHWSKPHLDNGKALLIFLTAKFLFSESLYHQADADDGL